MKELEASGAGGDEAKLKELKKEMENKLEKTKEDMKKLAGTKTGGAASNEEMKETLRDMRRDEEQTVLGHCLPERIQGAMDALRAHMV